MLDILGGDAPPAMHDGKNVEDRRDRRRRIFLCASLRSLRFLLRRSRSGRTACRRARDARGSPCCRPRIAARRRRAISAIIRSGCAQRRRADDPRRACARSAASSGRRSSPISSPVAAPRRCRRSEPRRRTRSARPRRAGKATRRRPPSARRRRRRAARRAAEGRSRARCRARRSASTIGRLPYVNAAQVDAAERTLDRVGRTRRRRRPIASASRRVSKASPRIQRKLRPPGDEALALLAAAGDSGEGRSGDRCARPPARARSADDGARGRCGDAGRGARTTPMRRSGGWRWSQPRLRRHKCRPPICTASLTAGRGRRFADRAPRGAAQPADA